MMEVEDKIGSLNWWRSPGFTAHGPADSILRLLEQQEISRRHALELLAYLYTGCVHAPPPVPWDKLRWYDEPARVMTVREACRQRAPLGGADAEALEHALTITERERDHCYKHLRRVSCAVRNPPGWKASNP